MKSTKKIKLKQVITSISVIMIFTFIILVMNTNNFKVYAYSQESIYFNMSGLSDGKKSITISHSNAKCFVENEDWITLNNSSTNSTGDTRILTVKPSTEISNNTGRRSGCITLYDSTYKKNVVKKYWVYQDVPLKKTGTPFKLNKLNKEKLSAYNDEYTRLTVDATGDGLTYEWWYINPGKSWVKSSKYQGSEYKCKMMPEKNGQRVYCVVRDKHGNHDSTEEVTLTMKKELKIKSCTGNPSAHLNQRANLIVDAEGEGLTYEWWYQNPGKSWVKSSMYQSNNYSCIMYAEKSGQKVYCRIIDENKNEKRTQTITLTATPHIGAWTVTKHATCTDNGLKFRICKICKARENSVIKKIGGSHNFNGSYVTTKKATCKTEGLQIGYCTKDNCNAIVSKRTINKLDHKWSNWYQIWSSTCLQNKNLERKCTRDNCNEVQTREIPREKGEYFTKATIDYPFGKLHHNGYVYKIWPNDLSEKDGWINEENIRNSKYGVDLINAAAIEFTEDDFTGPNLYTMLVDAQNIVYNTTDNYIVTYAFYKNGNERRVVIQASDSATGREYDNKAGTTKIEYKEGKKHESYWNEEHERHYNWNIWIDENGQCKMTGSNLSGDCYKIDGNRVTYPIGYKEPISTSETTISQAMYSAFPVIDAYSAYKEILLDFDKNTSIYESLSK